MSVRLSLLGFGNVGSHLYEAFRHIPSIHIVQVYSRRSSELKNVVNVPTISTLDALVDADIYIICVKDDTISALAQEIAHKNKLVVHTSGVLSRNCMPQAQRTGVFYPIQSFSKDVALDFSEVPIAITADNPQDLSLLRILASAISRHVFEVSDEQRVQLHLAAVFANNFVNAMYAISEEICKANALPFELLKPLIAETSRKIKENSPVKTQTGPAVRKDSGTIQRHLELLPPRLREIYQQISRNIQERYD